MLVYNPYDPKWKMLTADNFRVHFDSFFDSIKFVIFADCISSMCCITFSPLHTNSYGVFLVHTISFRLGFYLPFYVPKWIVLKKNSGCNFIVCRAEDHQSSSFIVLYHWGTRQESNSDWETCTDLLINCVYEHCYSWFLCSVKIVSFCETSQSLPHLSTHPYKHTSTEDFKEGF